MVQDRIADYYISRPNKKTGRFGRLVWTIPRAVGGRKVASVLIKCGSIASHAGVSADGVAWRETPVDWTKGGARRVIDIPQDFAGERVWLSLSNESTCECKFYGHILMG